MRRGRGGDAGGADGGGGASRWSSGLSAGALHPALHRDDVARGSTRRAPERVRRESIQHGLVDAPRFAPASRRAPFVAPPRVSRASPPPGKLAHPVPAPPIRADFLFRPGEASSAPVSPVSRPRANAPPPSFDVSDNARLALENKQAQVDALRAKLSAAEDALKARDARQKDLERRLARHEGDAVMQEAASLNDMMTNAMRDVRGFFSRAGSAPSATPPRTPSTPTRRLSRGWTAAAPPTTAPASPSAAAKPPPRIASTASPAARARPR